MEEDIKILEKFIECDNMFMRIDMLKNEDTIKAIEHLIAKYKELEDLYNKEKIKNRNVEMLRIACLPDNAKMVVMYKDDFNRNWRNDFIPKSKIKKAIKNYENEQKTLNTLFPEGSVNNWIIKGQIEVLQELLED